MLAGWWKRPHLNKGGRNRSPELIGRHWSRVVKSEDAVDSANMVPYYRQWLHERRRTGEMKSETNERPDMTASDSSLMWASRERHDLYC